MKYQCKDGKLLAAIQANVDKKHGLGFKYSHSVSEAGKRTRSRSWNSDLHYFNKAGKIGTVARGQAVSSITISLRVQP